MFGEQKEITKNDLWVRGCFFFALDFLDSIILTKNKKTLDYLSSKEGA